MAYKTDAERSKVEVKNSKINLLHSMKKIISMRIKNLNLWILTNLEMFLLPKQVVTEQLRTEGIDSLESCGLVCSTSSRMESSHPQRYSTL